MTLSEAKELLHKHNISFEQVEYENETEFFKHITMFPYTKKANPCRVIALVLHSKNEQKHIELQFNAVGDDFIFTELFFGDYGFELFDCYEEMLPNDLIEHISEITQGNLVIIVMNDIKNKRWIGDMCFSRNDNDTIGMPGLQKALHRIKKAKGFFAKLFKSKKQYEIYDWISYQCIIK